MPLVFVGHAATRLNAARLAPIRLHGLAFARSALAFPVCPSFAGVVSRRHLSHRCLQFNHAASVPADAGAPLVLLLSRSMRSTLPHTTSAGPRLVSHPAWPRLRRHCLAQASQPKPDDHGCCDYGSRHEQFCAAVVATVSGQVARWRQHVDQQASPLLAAHLSLLQEQDERSPAVDGFSQARIRGCSRPGAGSSTPLNGRGIRDGNAADPKPWAVSSRLIVVGIVENTHGPIPVCKEGETSAARAGEAARRNTGMRAAHHRLALARLRFAGQLRRPRAMRKSSFDVGNDAGPGVCRDAVLRRCPGLDHSHRPAIVQLARPVLERVAGRKSDFGGKDGKVAKPTNDRGIPTASAVRIARLLCHDRRPRVVHRL